MLYQTDLYLAPFDETGLHSDIAVKIHGAAMHAIPKEYAEKMHDDGVFHPFSVFAVPTGEGYLVRVSALNDAARVIPDALSELSAFRIFGCNRNRSVPILHRDAAPPMDMQTLENIVSAKAVRIDLVTPAVTKSNGRLSVRPELVSYFYSVMLKYNAFEHGNITFPEVQAAFQAVTYRAFQFRSTEYCVTGRRFPGMTGYAELLLPEQPEANLLLRRMFAYASYCGIGAKTGQGMGGIVVQSI